MRTILGAGAVGLALGARLARSGESVRFLVRRPEAAARLDAEGVVAEDPAAGQSWSVPVRATAGLDLEGVQEPLLLCVRRPELPLVARELGTRAPEIAVACFQNDVDGESLLGEHVRCVIGGVWRQTCTRLDDNRVRFSGAGRVVVGLHPRGRSPTVEELAGMLGRAGFDTAVSECIGEDKWLKLCVNLVSAPNALIRREDHATAAFVETKVRLLGEARGALQAAGIVARSCDGRDRSLDDEITHQRASLARGTSARRLPLYNQVWQSLHKRLPLEAHGYHRRVLGLARQHGLPAPANERVLRFLLLASERGLGPECFSAAELLGD